MKKRSHKRRAGEMEIRILRDGKVIFVAPDEKLLGVADGIQPGNANLSARKEGRQRDRHRTT